MAQEEEAGEESSAESEPPAEETPEQKAAPVIPTNAETKDKLDDMEEELEQDFEAAAAMKKKTPEARADKPENAKIVDKLEEVHEEISDDIVGVADNIDSFFVNRDVIEGRNNTNARLSDSLTFLEGEGAKNDFDFKFRLKLPALKEKLQLEFEDDFYDNNDGSTRATQYYTPQQQRDARSRGGLAYYEDLKTVKSKLTVGVEYDHEVVVFGKFRLYRDFILSKKQKISFIHDYFDDSRDRKGQRGTINYDYAFNKRYTFRLSNEELYKDEFNTFETAHGLALFQQVDSRRFLAYSYRVNSLNPSGIETFYLNNHIVSVVYRHRLYRKHLFGEIGPAVIWPKDKKFEEVWALTVKLELIFGNI